MWWQKVEPAHLEVFQKPFQTERPDTPAGSSRSRERQRQAGLCVTPDVDERPRGRWRADNSSVGLPEDISVGVVDELTQLRNFKSRRVRQHHSGGDKIPIVVDDVRPSSAPGLLRGTGLIARKTHENKFLQAREDHAVRSSIDNMRLEKKTSKTLVTAPTRTCALVGDDFESLQDQSLYDLVLYSGYTQRKKDCARKRRTNVNAMQNKGTASSPTLSPAGSRGTARAWEDRTSAEKMRDLRSTLGDDISMHEEKLALVSSRSRRSTEDKVRERTVAAATVGVETVSKNTILEEFRLFAKGALGKTKQELDASQKRWCSPPASRTGSKMA